MALGVLPAGCRASFARGFCWVDVPQLLAGRALLQHLKLPPETGFQEQTSPQAVSSAISLFQVYLLVTGGWSPISLSKQEVSDSQPHRGAPEMVRNSLMQVSQTNSGEQPFDAVFSLR